MKYQQEFLSTWWRDTQPLFEKHWEEVALNKDKIKLNPDWDAYQALKGNGSLRIFTMRDGDNLVGYFITIVYRHPHYKDHLFSDNDLIYILPEYRKGWAAYKLIKFAEKCLKEDGVSVLQMNTKAHRPFDKLLLRLGFKLAERSYSKFIGD